MNDDDKRVTRDGVTLAYEEDGPAEAESPPLLLVHGWGTDRSIWRPLLQAARTERRVVSVDLRGFGASDAPEQAYTIPGHSDDLAFLVERLGLHRPIVVGHSMGGMIALDFASRYPGLTGAAVLLEPMVVAPAPVLDGLRSMLAPVQAAGHRDFLRGLMTHLTGPHFDPEPRARLLDLIAACRQDVLVSTLEGMITFDSPGAAAGVRCPLLYVGTGITYADLERFRGLCPQLVTGQLVGCGHYFPLEVPEQVTAMIARFIRTHVAGTTSV